MPKPKPSSVLAAVTVDRVERLSPAFTRIWFAGAELADFGNPGRSFDQRIKVILPPVGRELPALTDGADWWQQWQALPEDERGTMRTYSIRDIVGAGPGTRVAIDFVLHVADGLTGPASRWASAAAPGDQVLLIGPRRGEPWGGVEFRPGAATSLLLAGDETAAPAICRILLDLEPGLTGSVFIEVPSEADILGLEPPPGFEIHWLARAAAPGTHSVGSRLVPAVVEHLGVHAHGRIQDADTEFPVWETPVFSSLGEDLEDGRELPGLYAWIAGESAVVTTLRRHLVRDVGLARGQVAFMGYWRQGAAARG